MSYNNLFNQVKNKQWPDNCLMRAMSVADRVKAYYSRDNEILHRFESGETLAAIGKAFNLSRERIRQIIHPNITARREHRIKKYQ